MNWYHILNLVIIKLGRYRILIPLGVRKQAGLDAGLGEELQRIEAPL